MNLFVSKTSSWLGLAFPFRLMIFSSRMSLSSVKGKAMKSLIQQNIGRKFWGPLLVPQKNSFSFIDFRIRASCSMNGWKAKAWKRPSTRIKTCAFCLTTGKAEKVTIGKCSIAKKGRGHRPFGIPRLNQGWTAYPLLNPVALMTEERHSLSRTLRLQSENVWWRGKR